MSRHSASQGALALLALAAAAVLEHSMLANALAVDRSRPPGQSLQPSPKAANSAAIADRPSDGRRPIWNLAHMVNSIKELDYRLAKGANAVEADVTFGRDGEPLYTYHGPPCDCWRHCNQQEDFNEYLSYVHEIAVREQPPSSQPAVGRNLTLLFLDLKLDYLDQLAKMEAGGALARSITTYLFPTPASGRFQAGAEPETTSGLRLILSVNHVTDIELIRNFVHALEARNASHLLHRIGFDVGMNDELHHIETMWRKVGPSGPHRLNIWQGDGYTNCLSPFYNLGRLSAALAKRDSPDGYPAKVYQWTIDIHERQREALRLGVDAVMTNHPERLVDVLREPEMAHQFRLAERADDPFQRLRPRPILTSRESARYQRSASPLTGGLFAGLLDVLHSWLAYMREIPYLSFPTTTRLMARAKSGIHKQALMARQSEPLQATTSATPSQSTSPALPPTTVLDDNNNNNSAGDQRPPYEGPSWFTSLLSGALVAMLKIALPVQSG